MNAPRISVYVKRRLRLDLLTPRQSQMVRIGDYSIDVWRGRIAQGINTLDQPSKTLGAAYGRRKARFGGRPIRDLKGISRSPRMLDNFSVRSVGNTSVRAGFTTTAARIKAKANEAIEPFMAFSPSDQRKIRTFAEAVLVLERIPNLAIQIEKK